MAVAGVGNATKHQIRSALGRLHRIEAVPAEPNAADAVAVAFCHLQESRMREVARR
jgi:Holliday junction resolvasome RuvABC endonuclease subunit